MPPIGGFAQVCCSRGRRPRYRPIEEDREMRHAQILDWLAVRLILVAWNPPRWTIGPPRRRHKRRRRDLP
jgi:hypothetical protein